MEYQYVIPALRMLEDRDAIDCAQCGESEWDEGTEERVMLDVIRLGPEIPSGKGGPAVSQRGSVRRATEQGVDPGPRIIAVRVICQNCGNILQIDEETVNDWRREQREARP